MLLSERLRQQGNMLFRWRSYLPFVLVPVVIVAASNSRHFEEWFGKQAEQAWDAFALMVSFTGLVLRALVVGYALRGTSGRNTRSQRADSLSTTGMYAVVRNPLYLGNFLVFLGFLLGVKVGWFVLIGLFCFVLYYERIIQAEEWYLEAKFGDAYRGWAERTPAVLPNPFLWRRPGLPFSLRTVLRRECSTFYLIVVVMTAIEIGGDMLGENLTFAEWMGESLFWVVFFPAGTLIFLALLALGQFTRLLHVPGR